MKINKRTSFFSEIYDMSFDTTYVKREEKSTPLIIPYGRRAALNFWDCPAVSAFGNARVSLEICCT